MFFYPRTLIGCSYYKLAFLYRWSVSFGEWEGGTIASKGMGNGYSPFPPLGEWGNEEWPVLVSDWCSCNKHRKSNAAPSPTGLPNSREALCKIEQVAQIHSPVRIWKTSKDISNEPRLYNHSHRGGWTLDGSPIRLNLCRFSTRTGTRLNWITCQGALIFLFYFL